jgi:hypothetical protein
MQACNSTSTGGNNTGIGYHALFVNTTGTEGAALGFEALRSNTTGHSNVAVGNEALELNTTASNNVAVGTKSLRVNTTGTDLVAIGFMALSAHTNNDGCTAIGTRALKDNTDGVNNTAVGNSAGEYTVSNTTGNRNTFIGALSHGPDADADNSIVIGYAVGGSNSTLTFGSGSTDTRCTHGSTTWSNPSDERIKKDITTSTAGLSFINDLRPVTFKYKNEGDIPSAFSGYVEDSTSPFNNSLTNHGFIAQEVKTAIDAHTELKDGFDMWSEGGNGRQRLGDSALVPMLVKAIQELSAKVEALENA